MDVPYTELFSFINWLGLNFYEDKAAQYTLYYTSFGKIMSSVLGLQWKENEHLRDFPCIREW